jgi:hypothetical protein
MEPELVGRDFEAARVDGIIEGLPEGGAALVLSGEPGVGKSALLHYARARADALCLRNLDPAVAAELVSVVAGQVRFRHPLVRSAVRQAASPAQVLETYGALAEVVADPERRTRAMAAVGYDEEVAAALDRYAVAARRRGAVMVAAGALERAAALTAGGSPSEGRAFGAGSGCCVRARRRRRGPAAARARRAVRCRRGVAR